MKKVLIVDDDDVNRDIIWKSLRRDDLELFEAANGAEAIALAATVAPDLVILDIMMPGMTGYEVCERLKQNSAPGGPLVLFLSARSSDVARMSAQTAGGDDYLSKPFSPRHLSDMVKKMLTPA